MCLAFLVVRSVCWAVAEYLAFSPIARNRVCFLEVTCGTGTVGMAEAGMAAAVEVDEEEG